MSEQKFSLHAQLEEVERELSQRREVYQRLVYNRKLRQSIADYQMARMEAVKKTLEWLLANETELRAFIENKKGAGEAPAPANATTGGTPPR